VSLLYTVLRAEVATAARLRAIDVLFSQALKNNHHVLHTLLPNKLEITYQLRHRSHNLTLPSQENPVRLLKRFYYKDAI